MSGGKMEIVQVMPVALEMVVAPPHNFAELWQNANDGAEEWMRRQWMKLSLAWLDAKEAKSKSPHTRRNYQRVLNLWLDFVAELRTDDGRPMQPWLVESRHVRAWQEYLLDEHKPNLSEVTVNHHLSCVSSFYSFVIDEKFMVNGVEMCLFVDAAQKTRANPFKYGNIRRSKTDQYERAAPLEPEDVGKVLRHLADKQHSLSGARNYALFLTYLYSGFRNNEVIRMQWKHLRPNKTQRETVVYAWQGKGGKKEEEALPPVAWGAIIHYLKLDGRWVSGVEAVDQPLEPDEFIWRPVVTHTAANLRTVDKATRQEAGIELDKSKPLSNKSALRIIQTCLRSAGIKDWKGVRVHDLRHTNARLLLEDGATETEIMKRLHHSSLATTGLYTKAIRKKMVDPMETRSARIHQMLLDL